MLSNSLIAVLLIFFIAAIIAGISLYNWQSRKKKGSDSFIRGLLAIVERDDEAAIKYLKDSATQNTQNIDAYIILGDLLRQQGDVAKAREIHTSLLARAFLKPQKKARIYKSLALDAVKENQYEKALDYINQAIALRADSWSKELLLDILEHLERWNDAFQVLSDLNGDEDILALYKVEYGRKFLEDDPHKARVIFKEALKYAPDCVPAMLFIGDAYASEKKMKDAVEWWTKIVEQNPENAFIVIDRLESAYYEMGEFDRARALYGRILNAHPESDVVRLEAAKILEKMGENERALNLLEQAPEDTKIISLAKARLNCIRGDAQTARKYIEKLIEQFEKPKLVCSSCGYETDEVMWRCPNCGEWKSFGI